MHSVFPDITRDDIFRIETARLWLRWLRASDAASITAFAGLESVARMTASIPHPYPPGEAERFILSARAATASGEGLVLALTLKNKARTLIGLLSAQSETAHEVEIGYVTAPTYAGRGYATEAVAALVDTIFNLTEVRLMNANSRTTNPASRRVLEKCGFAFLRTAPKDLPARGGRYSCDFFSLSRHHWAMRQNERRLPEMPLQMTRSVPQVQDIETQQQQQQQ